MFKYFKACIMQELISILMILNINTLWQELESYNPANLQPVMLAYVENLGRIVSELISVAIDNSLATYCHSLVMEDVVSQVDHDSQHDPFFLVRDRLLAKLISILENFDDFELQMETTKVIITFIDYYHGYVVFQCPNIESDDMRTLISLISSPYEEIALKSMKIIQTYNTTKTYTASYRVPCLHLGEHLVLKCGLMRELAKVATISKSTAFLQSVAATINTLDWTVFRSFKDYHADLGITISILMQSNNIQVLRMTIKALTKMTKFDSQHVREVFQSLPVTLEVLKSESPRLFDITVKLLELIARRVRFRSQTKLLIGSKIIIYLKTMLQNPGFCNISQFRVLFKVLDDFSATNDALLQKLISDSETLTTILSCAEQDFIYFRTTAWSIVFRIITTATSEQIQYLLDQSNLKYYLCNQLLNTASIENLRKTLNAMATIATKCKRFPSLSDDMKATVISRIDAIYKENRDINSISEPAQKLRRLMKTKKVKKFDIGCTIT
ncbi:hypothetical protein TrispH2_002538 [Trichoplax sp. H2]|nr:hypothetical protein TrispH2_002538 [Trichoplax sp. H2]|eukprot:RDD45205.1 hypothetical protein TrispH2_002538 [Trichoplax sp. H2]